MSPQNQVYSLDRQLLSTRTRHPNQRASFGFQANDLPPYNYLLPVADPMTLSYDLSLGEISAIQFSPTRLESTSLMLIHGQSLFLNKVMPDNSFDKLGDDFNYVFLVLSVLLVLVATKTAQTFVSKTRVNQLFA